MPEGTPSYYTVDNLGRVTAHFQGVIVADPASSVPAQSVTGQLTDAQLQSLSALKVTGQLTDSQIAAIAAAKVTGQITDAQIQALSTSKLSGTVSGATIIAPGSITTGLIAANAIVANLIAANQIDGSKIRVPAQANGGSLGASNTVDFTDAAGGANVLALLQAVDTTTGTTEADLYLIGNPNAVRTASRVLVEAVSSLGYAATVDMLTTSAAGVTVATSRASASSAAGTFVGTIIDGNNNSSFLRCGSATHIGQSQSGTTAVTWPGGVTAYQAPTITLPFTPGNAVASAVNTNSVGQVLVTPQTITNGIALFLTEVPANVVPVGTITYISWIAWT